MGELRWDPPNLQTPPHSTCLNTHGPGAVAQKVPKGAGVTPSKWSTAPGLTNGVPSAWSVPRTWLKAGIEFEPSHLEVTTWLAQASGGELPPDAFAFSPLVESTVPFRPDNVTSLFIRVRGAVGAPDVRLHDLRHFTATQLIGAGVDVRTVADFLGHSDPSLTPRVYSHAIEERNRAAAAIMGQVLGA